jgi:hypothetical protein
MRRICFVNMRAQPAIRLLDREATSMQQLLGVVAWYDPCPDGIQAIVETQETPTLLAA